MPGRSSKDLRFYKPKSGGVSRPCIQAKTPTGSYMKLRITGSELKEYGIHPGDTVIADPEKRPMIDDLVIMNKNGRCIIKRYARHEEIQGVVIRIMKGRNQNAI